MITENTELSPQIHLHRSPSLRELPLTLGTLPRFLPLLLIHFYQQTISHALGDTCRFYPSCSHYSYQAIYKYGLLKGGWMTIHRLMRCNPFNPGGYDPVP